MHNARTHNRSLCIYGIVCAVFIKNVVSYYIHRVSSAARTYNSNNARLSGRVNGEYNNSIALRERAERYAMINVQHP